MDMMDATERDGRNGRRQTQQCAPDATVRAGRDGARPSRGATSAWRATLHAWSRLIVVALPHRRADSNTSYCDKIHGGYRTVLPEIVRSAIARRGFGA